MDNRNIVTSWYGQYKSKPKKTVLTEEKPYKVRIVREDMGVPAPGVGDNTVDAFSPAQAKLKFIKKYPHLSDYGDKVVVEVDGEKYRQRKQIEEMEKKKKEETIQNAWWNND